MMLAPSDANRGAHAILLAAGTGTRFGGGKLLSSFHGKPLILGALAAVLASPVESIVLVTGHDAGNVESAVRKHAIAAAQNRPITFVHARDYRQGMGASLATGIRQLPVDATSAIVFLADMPRIPPGLAGSLLAALQEADILAAAPLYRGQRGHPVAFRKDLFPALALLTGDEGARQTLRDLGRRLALVPVDDAGVLFDVDTPDDVA